MSGKSFQIPSLVKKYLMALTGLVGVGFVLGHMLGNLQIFLPPDYINAYAYKLQSLPIPVLWGIRLFLLGAIGVHVWMAILLTIENKKARPAGYDAEQTVQASLSSRIMPYTGIVVLAFVIFHIAHFTMQTVHPEYQILEYHMEGYDHPLHDVYAMMILGFSYETIAVFYLVAMGLLCSHLMHGTSSMFQSLGFRNERWRYRLNKFALVYAVFIFIGFACIPAAVLLGKYNVVNVFEIPVSAIVQQVEEKKSDAMEQGEPIFIDYNHNANDSQEVAAQ